MSFATSEIDLTVVLYSLLDGGEGDFTHDASFLPLSVELMAGRLVFDDLLLHRRGH